MFTDWNLFGEGEDRKEQEVAEIAEQRGKHESRFYLQREQEGNRPSARKTVPLRLAVCAAVG